MSYLLLIFYDVSLIYSIDRSTRLVGDLFIFKNYVNCIMCLVLQYIIIIL